MWNQNTMDAIIATPLVLGLDTFDPRFHRGRDLREMVDWSASPTVRDVPNLVLGQAQRRPVCAPTRNRK